MTNTTLREEIKKHYFFVESKTSIVDWLAKEEWSLNENALLDFIESKVKEARQEMKKECLAVVPEISQSVIDTYDEYTRYGSRVIGDMERQNEIRTAINSLK